MLAAIGATIIYGLNHTIAKSVMPDYVQPYGFILLRVSGAALLFWIVSFFVPWENIARKDWVRLFVCSALGAAVNMLSFFKGLSLSTPINSAVLVTTTPIIVIVLSALLIKEKITLLKAMGVLIGFIGAVTLITFGAETRQDAPNIPLGNILFIVNSTCYGTYLILVKKLIETYHPFTVMKWLFTVGVLINLPIAYHQVLEIQWSELPLDATFAILFVVVGTTFLTYLFNVFALRQLKASTLSAFVYLQPLIGILFALFTGKDQLTTIKVIAIILVLTGIYLASKRHKPIPNP